jgi:flagellar hook assembly protein FlgD
MKTLSLLFFLCTSTLYSQTYYMNLWSNGKVTSIPIQYIQKVTFSNTPSAIGNKKITTVIESFKLLQNYPNPFNPSTTIEYQIPAEGNVEVRIFTINGQLIRTFKNVHTSSGSHSVTWDGNNEAGQSAASGLYIYQVSYANSIVAKKMMFVK